MIEIFCIIENIRKTEGMVCFIIGSKTRGRYLCHGDDAGHKLFHVFIFRTKLAVGIDLYLYPSVCPLFYFFSKFSHCNMYGMAFAESMSQSQHHGIFRCGGVAGLGRSAASTPGQSKNHTGSQSNCCKLFH